MRILAVLFALLWCGPAMAQSSPGFVLGQVPSAAQWNSYFSAKMDATNGVASGTTLTSPAITGGSLAGTIAGTPTFSGALTLSGTPNFSNGAALVGTFSGTPTFSGSVTMSGSNTGLSVTNTLVSGFVSQSSAVAWNGASFPGTGNVALYQSRAYTGSPSAGFAGVEGTTIPINLLYSNDQLSNTVGGVAELEVRNDVTGGSAQGRSTLVAEIQLLCPGATPNCLNSNNPHYYPFQTYLSVNGNPSTAALGSGNGVGQYGGLGSNMQFGGGSNIVYAHEVNNEIDYIPGVPKATFTGSISGTTLTVSAVTGTIAAGQQLLGAGVSVATYIVSGSGTSWTVNNSQSVGSESMSATNASTDFAEFMKLVNFAPAYFHANVAEGYLTLSTSNPSTEQPMHRGILFGDPQAADGKGFPVGVASGDCLICALSGTVDKAIDLSAVTANTIAIQIGNVFEVTGGGITTIGPQTAGDNYIQSNGNTSNPGWGVVGTGSNGSFLITGQGTGGVALKSGNGFLFRGLDGGSGSALASYPQSTAVVSGSDASLSVGGTLSNIVIGTGGALATTATTGFLRISGMAGASTGTIANVSAAAPAIWIDTTDKKICYEAVGGTPECSAAFSP